MNRLIIGLVGIGVLCCTAASAAEKGSAGGQMLKIGIGARPAAMGAFCAVSNDVNNIHYNPAGLAQIQKTQVCITHQEWLDDVRQQSIDCTRRHTRDGVFGASLVYLSMGKLDGRNAAGGKINSFEANDVAIGLSYARLLKEHLAVGIGSKLLQQRISSEEATAIMADMGVILRLSESLSIGSTLQNLGTRVRFIDKGDRLPLTFKIGSAYTTLQDKLLITVDINKPVDNDTNIGIGTEWKATQAIAVRAGYNSGINHGSVGVGFHIKDCQIDYAFMPYSSDLGDTHRISCSFGIGSK